MREAKGESGCSIKDLKYTCSQNPSNGMSDAVVHCFVAKAGEIGDLQDTDEIYNE